METMRLLSLLFLHLFVINFCYCHYFRNTTTTTAKPTTPRCSKNRVYSACGNNGCQNTCENPTLSHVCKGPCIPGCICKEGFLLNDLKKCVPIEKCGRCSDPNEVYIRCPNPCPGGTCEQPDFISCRKACLSHGCQCKPGYVRDGSGKCIPLDKCPQPCGPNEVWNPCASYCNHEETCDSLFRGINNSLIICDVPSGVECQGKCECSTGFVRIDNNCVPPSECCPLPNTKLVNCPNPCFGGTCPNPNFESCDTPCEPMGCQCKEGFVKSNDNLCIPLADCVNEMVTCSPNEIWNPCPRYCSSDMTCGQLLFGFIPDCPPPPPNWVCRGKCECHHSDVRINGICAPPDACCMDPNAILVDCPNPCPGGTCLQPFFSACDFLCRPRGCQCKPGYVKKFTSGCVPLSSCGSPVMCPENEVYNACPNACNAEANCDEYVYGIAPPSCDNLSRNSCEAPRCECIKPFARNREGVCVHPDKCCFDPNAEVVANPVCCPGRDCCPGMSCTHPEKLRCTLPCNVKGCQCKSGYLRLSENNNVCVLAEECQVILNTTLTTAETTSTTETTTTI